MLPPRCQSLLHSQLLFTGVPVHQEQRVHTHNHLNGRGVVTVHLDGANRFTLDMRLIRSTVVARFGRGYGIDCTPAVLIFPLALERFIRSSINGASSRHHGFATLGSRHMPPNL